MMDKNQTPAAAHGGADLIPNGQPSLGDRVRSLRLKPPGPKYKPPSTWLPWGLTAIALVLAGAFGWRAYRLAPADAGTGTEDRGSLVESRDAKTVDPRSSIADPQPASPGEVVLDAKGYIIAAHQIQLSPQGVGGEIIWLDPEFKEGAVYKKGDSLAELDPVIYAAQVKSAQAMLRVAEVNLQQAETGSTLNEIKVAKAQLHNLAAKLELSLIDENTKRRAGVAVSRNELDKATVQIVVDRAARDQQKEALEKLEVLLEEQRRLNRAQVQKAQADVDSAKKQLYYCTIRAPTTGIVLTKKAELGGYVNPLAFGASGSLCEIADLRNLEVEVDIQERDTSRVKPGQRCRIMPEAGQRDDEFKRTHPDGYAGIVSRRMPVANRSKGAITWRVKVNIPDNEKSGEYLLPDMGVLVSFLK